MDNLDARKVCLKWNAFFANVFATRVAEATINRNKAFREELGACYACFACFMWPDWFHGNNSPYYGEGIVPVRAKLLEMGSTQRSIDTLFPSAGNLFEEYRSEMNDQIEEILAK